MVPSLTGVIELATLEAGLPGVSVNWAATHLEACLVRLVEQGHQSGVLLHVDGITTGTVPLEWDRTVTDQVKRSWGNEATEIGACAIAFLLILHLTEFTVIRRSRTGTGIDYWLGFKDKPIILEDAARLEISGIMNGNKSAIQRRVNEKKAQTKPTDGALPAYVVVVEFGKPQAQVVKK